MRNGLLGPLVLVSSVSALVLGIGRASGDDDDSNTKSGSDGGSTGDSSVVTSGNDSGTSQDGAISTTDGGSKTDGGGVTKIPAPVSTCAPAKVALAPAVETKFPDTTTSTENLAVDDFNNDGADDIAVLVDSTAVDVFFSKKDGTFSAPLLVADDVGNGPGFAVGDFSGDGIPDIVVSTFGADPTTDDSLDLYVSNGDGTFQTAKNFPDLSTTLFQVVAADFNKDGKLDLLYNGQDGQGVLLNNGQGFASPGTKVVIPIDQDIFAAGDFNGDGAADIVYANVDNGACIQLNNGAGTIGTSVCYPEYPATAPNIAAAGDVNGDGKLDVVTFYDGHSGTSTAPNVAVYLGKGDGTLGAVTPTSLVKGPIDGVVLVDTNNDGKLDIVTVDGTSINLLVNSGTGTFTTAPATYGLASGTGAAEFPVVSGDFLGNGLRGFAALDLTEPATGIAVITATCSN